MTTCEVNLQPTRTP